jgi:hypothetical protein
MSATTNWSFSSSCFFLPALLSSPPPPTPPNLHKFSSQNSEPNQAHFGNVTKILRKKQNRVSTTATEHSLSVYSDALRWYLHSSKHQIRSHQNATKRKTKKNKSSNKINPFYFIFLRTPSTTKRDEEHEPELAAAAAAASSSWCWSQSSQQPRTQAQERLSARASRGRHPQYLVPYGTGNRRLFTVYLVPSC